MDLQNILQDERKKKFLIIGLIIFFVVIGSILIFSRSSVPTTGTEGEDGQTQLLTDLSQLAPRDGVAQDQNRLIAPIVKVSADVPVVAPGQPSVISWNAANATSCVDGNGNAIRTSGSLSITPQENYTMDVVCTNPKGTTIESITVAVTTTPIITLLASPEEVLKGEQSFISWTTVNTTRCVDAAGKTLRLSGGMPVAPQTPYTFEISCTGPNGTDKKSVTVNIVKEKTTPGVVYVYKWKATPGGPFQTSTFQTNTQCQEARAASTGYDKTACTKVTVSSTTGGTTTTTTTTGTGTNTGTGVLACATPLTQSMASGSTDAASNGEVTMLQNFLHEKGFLTSTATGNFGSETASALRKFQESVGLTATGISNTETRKAIQKENCKSVGLPMPGDPVPTTTDPVTDEVTDDPTIPVVRITVEPDVVGFGTSAGLSWEMINAVSCTFKTSKEVIIVGSGDTGSYKMPAGHTVTFGEQQYMKGSYKIKIDGRDSLVTFTFSCLGSTGKKTTKSKDLKFDANSVPITGPADVYSLSADPTAIAEASIGSFSEVSWVSDNATSCRAHIDAYAEVLTDKGWEKIYSDTQAGNAVETSGQIRIKPGYDGTSVPQQQKTSTCPPYSGDGIDTCSPTTYTTGNGTRLTDPNSNPIFGPPYLPTAHVTIACEGPVALTSANRKRTTGSGEVQPSRTINIPITPTPSSGGGGW